MSLPIREIQMMGASMVRPEAPPLWLPPALKRRRIVVPDVLHVSKVIYFKGRLFVSENSPNHYRPRVDTRWYGDVLRTHYNVDLDEPGADNVSLRDQIHIYLTGKLERVEGGWWVFQQSDERHSTTMIEEWPEFQHNEMQWARFFRRES
jgi:hypothetical protein